MSERGEVKRDGSTAQPNSGRGKWRKGDAILEPFCVDYKEYGKTFGLSVNVWGKVSTDAFRSGRRHPALKLILGPEESPVRLWVVDDVIFHQMREAWLEKYGE